MACLSVQTERILSSSQEIVKIAERVSRVQARVEGVRLDGVLDIQSRYRIDCSIRSMIHRLTGEAAHMNCLSSALEEIARLYQETERSLSRPGNQSASEASSGGQSSDSQRTGTDKRNPLQRFLDWLCRKKKNESFACRLTSRISAAAPPRKRKSFPLW